VHDEEGRLKFIATREDEKYPQGAHKICKATRREIKTLIPFFEKQAHEGLSPKKIRELYYGDDNPTPLAEQRKVLVALNSKDAQKLHVEWGEEKHIRRGNLLKQRTAKEKLYAVWLISGDLQQKITVWTGRSAQDAAEAARQSQAHLDNGWDAAKIQMFFVQDQITDMEKLEFFLSRKELGESRD
jgi:hypothetical protein